jgi:hypothetical protein
LHGEGLVRLAGREDVGQQRAVYVKLHLLQGALAFVNGEPCDARSCLTRAEALRREVSLTAEDDGKLASLVALGISEKSARESLLACSKDVDRAAARALEKEAAERARAAARRAEREMAKYGKTARGRYVDARALALVSSVGYEASVAAEALRRSENDPDGAMGLLCEPQSFEAIQLAAMQRQPTPPPATVAPTAPLREENVASLREMGFTDLAARAALRATANDLALAATALSAARGEGPAALSTEEEEVAAHEPMDVAAALDALPAPPAPPPVERMSTEEYEAVEGAGLRQAVVESEKAYAEANLADEALMLRYLLGKLGEQEA